MATKKLGSQTVKFSNPPHIVGTSSIVGTKEGQGPLSKFFDEIMEDDLWGEKTWEKTESKLMRETITMASTKASITTENLDYIISGDLLNQCISSSYAIRDLARPFFGIYGACSTMAESLSIGAMLVDGGFADFIACATSSHFCAAERQFRFPLELGTQRPPTAQWTVTGAGTAVLSANGNGPHITHVTTGKIVDLGIKDANNMGAAMAPAAADTIYTHLKDTGRDENYYDLILTGDLGYIGKEITNEMLIKQGYRLEKKFDDCGVLIFEKNKQDTHSGGSGCGCSASVFCGYIYKTMLSGGLKRVLLVSTGALMSPTSTQQGESIPGIAHAVSIEI